MMIKLPNLEVLAMLPSVSEYFLVLLLKDVGRLVSGSPYFAVKTISFYIEVKNFG